MALGEGIVTKRTNPEFEIIGVLDAGDIKKESLVLRAITDIANLQDFMVMDSTFDPQAGKSNLLRHIYRFPAKTPRARKVKKGDVVAVFTGEGDNSESPFDDSSSRWAHIYHMKLKTTIWNQSGDTATVLYCEEVDSKKV